MKYSIAGTVAHVGPLESLGAKGTAKRTFTIAIGNSQYPNDVPLDLWKEAAETPPEAGQKIEAEFYLQGREWNGKHYVSLKCAGWKADGAAPVPRGKPASTPAIDAMPNDGDSLPF